MEHTSVECEWELRSLTELTNICHYKLRFGDSAFVECAALFVAAAASCCSSYLNTVAAAVDDEIEAFDVEDC